MADSGWITGLLAKKNNKPVREAKDSRQDAEATGWKPRRFFERSDKSHYAHNAAIQMSVGVGHPLYDNIFRKLGRDIDLTTVAKVDLIEHLGLASKLLAATMQLTMDDILSIYILTEKSALLDTMTQAPMSSAPAGTTSDSEKAKPSDPRVTASPVPSGKNVIRDSRAASPPTSKKRSLRSRSRSPSPRARKRRVDAATRSAQSFAQSTPLARAYATLTAAPEPHGDELEPRLLHQRGSHGQASAKVAPDPNDLVEISREDFTVARTSRLSQFDIPQKKKSTYISSADPPPRRISTTATSYKSAQSTPQSIGTRTSANWRSEAQSSNPGSRHLMRPKSIPFLEPSSSATLCPDQQDVPSPYRAKGLTEKSDQPVGSQNVPTSRGEETARNRYMSETHIPDLPLARSPASGDQKARAAVQSDDHAVQPSQRVDTRKSRSTETSLSPLIRGQILYEEDPESSDHGLRTAGVSGVSASDAAHEDIQVVPQHDRSASPPQHWQFGTQVVDGPLPEEDDLISISSVPTSDDAHENIIPQHDRSASPPWHWQFGTQVVDRPLPEEDDLVSISS